jgi:hypothetical protein
VAKIISIAISGRAMPKIFSNIALDRLVASFQGKRRTLRLVLRQATDEDQRRNNDHAAADANQATTDSSNPSQKNTEKGFRHVLLPVPA